MITPVKRFFREGHERSLKAKKNIASTFVLKGLSIVINLLLVPLTIHYLNPTRYGIWITLSSIIGWFSFFDIGFGNGLRNKFAEALANGKFRLARIYVSTTYATLSIIIGVILVLFLIINPFINWSGILNAEEGMAEELSVLALVLFAFFSIQFVVQLLNTIITANQEPSKASALNLIGNVLALAIIFVLTRITSGNLIYLAFSLGVVPALVLAVASIWFYKNDYKHFSPSFRYVRFSFARSLMKIGIKFFIIQIGAVVLFQTNNIIISQLFGPTKVTEYNIAFKYFNLTLVFFNIIMAPYWSAFTDAWTKKDYVWIKSTLNKLHRIAFLMIGVNVVLLLCSGTLYRLWVGNEIHISIYLSITVALSGALQMLQSINLYFLNGTSKINLQLILVILTSLINIPLALFFGKLWDVPGVILSSVTVFTIISVFVHIQTRKILNQTTNAIWAN